MVQMNQTQLECSGWEFTLGSIRGIRAWNMDQEGRLVPISMHGDAPWAPGENLSECSSKLIGGHFRGGYFGATTPVSRWWNWVTPPAHDLASCTCGFYAWHNTRVEMGNPAIIGVVEGYGKVVVGTQGFRAEKARILALAVTDFTEFEDDLGTWEMLKYCASFGKWLPETVQNEIDRLSSLYGVPVYEDKRKMLLDFPVERVNPQKELMHDTHR